MADARPGLLHDPRWERWAGAGGVLFVVLTVIWALLIRQGPSLDDSAQTITSYYGDSRNQDQVVFASVLLGFAGIFFLWFLGSLRTTLRRAEGDPGRLSAVAFGGGVALVALMFVKGAIEPALAGAVDHARDFQLDPNTAKLLDSLFFSLLAYESVAGAVLVAATSAVALKTGLFPAWLAWAGVVVAVLNALALLAPGLPLVLLLAWVAVVSVLIWRGAQARPAATQAPA